jgi:methylated-DNA-[protein]-cysteine S-methyltransferase
MKTPTSTEPLASADFDTPVGPMRARASARGLRELHFDARAAAAAAADTDDGANAAARTHLDAARRWLDLYWQGLDPDASVRVALDVRGTPFQLAVWRRLRTIGWGRTASYGEVAADVAARTAPRAAGVAIGRNPVALIVPCHRVIGKDGSLTGYAGGLERKQTLLVHEGALLA